MRLFRANHQNRSRASAVLVVLVLLASMAIMLYANTQALNVLQKELKLLDQKHRKQHEQGKGH